MTNLDPNFWGPAGWRFMHSIAEAYEPTEEKKKAAADFFSSIQKLLPCSSCCKHCCEQLENDPVEPHLGSRDELSKYVFDFHNSVNSRTGKPEFSWDAYVSMYRSDQAQCGAVAPDSQQPEEAKRIWTTCLILLSAIVVTAMTFCF